MAPLSLSTYTNVRCGASAPSARSVQLLLSSSSAVIVVLIIGLLPPPPPPPPHRAPRGRITKRAAARGSSSIASFKRDEKKALPPSHLLPILLPLLSFLPLLLLPSRRARKGVPDIRCRVFLNAGSWKSRPFPQERFFVLSRFLTVPGPVEGPRRPKTAKDLRRAFSRRRRSGWGPGKGGGRESRRARPPR